MDIYSDRIVFDRHSGSGPRRLEKIISLRRPTKQVQAALTGFRLSYSGQEDHHIGLAETFVAAHLINPQTMRVGAALGLRDWSDDWDDAYEGWIDFTVFAEPA